MTDVTDVTDMTDMTGPEFQLTGELPTGRLAIQASAGTGKTFALATLATRFIAEGVISASELLIVTFTRAATSEIRARVRDQMVEAAKCLAGEVKTSTNQQLMDHLASDDCHRRLDRLKTAITEFDTATITTIHGFAVQARNLLGSSTEIDPDARLVNDLDELIDEVCTDVLARAAVEVDPDVALPKLKELTGATRSASGQPDLTLLPASDAEGVTHDQAVLRALVQQSLDAIATRRRRSGTLSFDGLLTDLRDALAGNGSEGAIEALRGRYKVALIDEFQDTDSVQWDIFSKLFGQPGTDSVLVLVGDPKQAIYSFRGADIHAYLRAVAPGSGIGQRSLIRNWRSDGAVLESLRVLFDGTTFGNERIPFVRVDAAPANRDQHILDEQGRPLPALELRVATGGGLERLKNGNRVQADGAAKAVDQDLVAHIRSLLGKAQIPHEGGEAGTRHVRPSDIAVLVTTRAHGESIQRALVDQGVPAVMANGGSVLASPAAQQMRYLLNAMARPSDPQRARMFTLSWFVGWDAGEVASSLVDEGKGRELTDWQERLREWSDLFSTCGVAEVFARVWANTGVTANVLKGIDGDRHLTDLDHLVELFHGEAQQGQASVAGLIALLDSGPTGETDTEVEENVAARRIESEDEAVQIMTVWLAKGLEFPVVCLPTLWRDVKSKYRPVISTDPITSIRTLDVTRGGPWPDPKSAKKRTARSDEEADGERLRLLYVALTRAKHQTAVWWANGMGSDRTALARMFFARTDGVIDADRYGTKNVVIPGDGEIEEVLGQLVAGSQGTIRLRTVDSPNGTPPRWVDPQATASTTRLELAPFDITLDRSAHRWSFSTIAHHALPIVIDPFDASLADGGAGDEGQRDIADGGWAAGAPEREGADPFPADSELATPSSTLSLLPAGTEFGTLVHAVLEKVDFTSDAIDEELGREIDRQMVWRTLDLRPVAPVSQPVADGRALLISGLRSALQTPLGPLCGDLCLADFGPEDRLNEVSFDLRLGADGHHPRLRDIGRLLLTHLADDDPLHGWAAHLAAGSIDIELAGHLTGSIDLVLRVGGRSSHKHFVVADYKTNQLWRRDQPADAAHYRPEALAAAMAEHDYPLQALLYSVALHRYLRWRMKDYDPRTHLGGAAYLFLRGMSGPGVTMTDGQPHGIFSWSMPSLLVTELSDLLDGRPPAGSRV